MSLPEPRTTIMFVTIGGVIAGIGLARWVLGRTTARPAIANCLMGAGMIATGPALGGQDAPLLMSGGLLLLTIGVFMAVRHQRANPRDSDLGAPSGR